MRAHVLVCLAGTVCASPNYLADISRVMYSINYIREILAHDSVVSATEEYAAKYLDDFKEMVSKYNVVSVRADLKELAQLIPQLENEIKSSPSTVGSVREPGGSVDKAANLKTLKARHVRLSKISGNAAIVEMRTRAMAVVSIFAKTFKALLSGTGKAIGLPDMPDQLGNGNIPATIRLGAIYVNIVNMIGTSARTVPELHDIHALLVPEERVQTNSLKKPPIVFPYPGDMEDIQIPHSQLASVVTFECTDSSACKAYPDVYNVYNTVDQSQSVNYYAYAVIIDTGIEQSMTIARNLATLEWGYACDGNVSPSTHPDDARRSGVRLLVYISADDVEKLLGYTYASLVRKPVEPPVSTNPQESLDNATESTDDTRESRSDTTTGTDETQESSSESVESTEHPSNSVDNAQNPVGSETTDPQIGSNTLTDVTDPTSNSDVDNPTTIADPADIPPIDEDPPKFVHMDYIHAMFTATLWPVVTIIYAIAVVI